MDPDSHSRLSVLPFRRKIGARLLRAFFFFVIMPVVFITILSDFLIWTDARRSSTEELTRVARSYGYGISRELELVEKEVRTGLDTILELDVSDLNVRELLAESMPADIFEATLYKGTQFWSMGTNDLRALNGVERWVEESVNDQTALHLLADVGPVFVRRSDEWVLVAYLRSGVLQEQVVRNSLIFKSYLTLFGPRGGIVVDSFTSPVKTTSMHPKVLGPQLVLYEYRQDDGRSFCGVEQPLVMPESLTAAPWMTRLMVDEELFMSTAGMYRRLSLTLAGLIMVVIILMGAIVIRLYMVHLDTLLIATAKIADRQFKHRVHIQTGDEFESLGEAFNAMAGELQENERLLVDKHRMETIGFLTAGLVHEINNPNHYINLSATLLIDLWRTDVGEILDRYVDMSGEPSSGTLPYAKMRVEVPRMLDRIKGGSARITKIIDDLKRYSRRQEREDPVAVDVNSMIRGVAEMMDFQIEKATSNFTMELDPSLPAIMGIEHRLEQVVVNLLQNSCFAMESLDDTIQVRTWKEAGCDRIVIEFHDTGIGLGEDAAAQLTTAFFTTRGESGGVGLGLFVSNEIVKGHGGRLEFSGEKGVFTTVRVSLPVGDLG